MPQSIESSIKPGRWLSLGLQPLNECEWLETGADAVQQIELKRELVDDRRHEVFADLPESIDAQQELLDLLIAHLLQYYPQQYRQEGNQVHHDPTAQTWNISEFAEYPLALAGRLVSEDWCVLLPSKDHNGEYILAAGAVCFPFRWRLQDKLGRSLSGIHAPVPGYAEKLSRPVDSVFDRLRSDYPSVRFNWGIVDTPSLFLPATHSETPVDPTISAQNAGNRLWLRIERQTLRRLPTTGGIVFGIRTAIESLHEIKTNPGRANHLEEAIEQLPPTAQSYKSLLPLRSVLLDYLHG